MLQTPPLLLLESCTTRGDSWSLGMLYIFSNGRHLTDQARSRWLAQIVFRELASCSILEAAAAALVKMLCIGDGSAIAAADLTKVIVQRSAEIPPFAAYFVFLQSLCNLISKGFCSEWEARWMKQKTKYRLKGMNKLQVWVSGTACWGPLANIKHIRDMDGPGLKVNSVHVSRDESLLCWLERVCKGQQAHPKAS